MSKLAACTLLFILYFFCASNFWAVQDVDNPSAEELYRMYQDSPRRHVDGSTSQFTSKSEFTTGANKVIKAMQNNRPFQTNFSGMPSHLLLPESYTDPEFGLPSQSLGCCRRDPTSPGRRAALLWYADRGKYPINSTKPRHPAASVPQAAQWAPFSSDGARGVKWPGAKELSFRLSS